MHTKPPSRPNGRAWLPCLALTALLILVSAPSATARSLQEQERSVISLLNAFEYVPSRRVLDRIGPDVNEVLVRVSTFPRLRSTIRVRALSSLALYPSDRTQRYLVGLLYDRELRKSSVGLLLRRQAMRSLGFAFGEDAIKDIKQFRSDEDPQIRESCAHALGDTLSARAEDVLAAWLPLEKELFIRLAIESSIKRIRKHNQKPRK